MRSKIESSEGRRQIPTMSKYLLGYKYIFQLLYKYSSKLQEEHGEKVLGLTPKMCVEAAKKAVDKKDSRSSRKLIYCTIRCIYCTLVRRS